MPTQQARRRLVRALIPAWLGALLLALAFPPYSFLSGWLALPAVALLIHGLRSLSARGSALVGLLAGLLFFGILLRWAAVLGPDAWVALTLLCAVFWIPLGALMPAAARTRWAVLAVPLLWAGVEALRARIPWGGFPWGRLAFAEAENALGGWAPVGGAPLVSLVVAMGAMLLLGAWDALRVRDRRRALVAVGGLAGLVIGGLVLGAQGWGGPVVGQAPIAVVQGNVPRAGLDFNAQRRAVLDNHVRVTLDLADAVAAGRAPAPQAVVWPENSSDLDPLVNEDAAAQITLAARAIGVPILVGSIVVNPADPPAGEHPGTILNVGMVWDPQTGPGQVYAKRHPVPFGEYLPLRGLLSRFITRFDRIPRDFAGGREPGLLDLNGIPAGVVICFEVAYDSLPADAVRAGGQVLVVQTNNATYARTGQPEQQLAMTVLRARETGRETLVAATSGISAEIHPDGVVGWQAPEMTSAWTVAQVPLRAGLTPAVRLGPLPDLAMLIGLLVVVLTAVRRPAQRAPQPPAQEPVAGAGHGTIDR